jgi:hypothetical protein
MSSSTMRHWVVALGLVAVAGVTAASAAGFGHTVHGAAGPAARGSLPVFVSGDLGEVVVYAPGDLGEVVVHAPHDLGEVLVNVARTPPAGTYLAEVVVTATRDGGELLTDTATAASGAGR